MESEQTDDASEQPQERPNFGRFLAAELLWWAAWFGFSFLVGLDITDQLTSIWFWAVATGFAAWAAWRWRNLDALALGTRTPGNLVGGHHDATSAQVTSPGRGRRIQRGMIVYFTIAFIVLVLASLSVGPDIAEGRSILLGEEISDTAYLNWAEGVAAADAEILGLTIYDYALLVGLAFITIEVIAVLRKPGGNRKLWFSDTFASLSTQIPFYVVEIFSFLAMIATYFVLWDNVTPYQLPVNGWVIAAGVIAADFAYYWEHRTSHEIRLLWTGHAVHHSSPIFNTAVAFRFGPLEPFVAIMFHLPLIVLGFHPAIVILGELSVQAYQFWIHTDVIGRLGPLDRILNTPSNHRVHHGSDHKYLDRNHGGILMIWDRIFGTYQAEEETPIYGLTTQINTTNPFRVWVSEFPPLFADLKTSKTWGDWFGYLLNPPGWKPATETSEMETH